MIDREGSMLGQLYTASYIKKMQRDGHDRQNGDDARIDVSAALQEGYIVDTVLRSVSNLKYWLP